ncbi:MAG: alpha/beta hydrolase [Rhodospirillales bacterium CG15_BIG_FIL_POST_REV_8_21_14_020_66_15]|nr:MAG: alpha/beta hydrolase [Rhodospirillales bacterium CG15_BIG_FIL_POST_REV_8_21_14_020_66_15]
MDHAALAQEVAALAAKARRLETPGPNGPAVWHRWEGGGPPLVLMHGGWGSWTHWFRAIPLLTPHFTLLAPDTPGFGDSAVPPKPTSPDDIADILVAGLDQLLPAGETFHLAGFSFGGLIGSVVAAKTPGRCRSFVAVGASGFGTLHSPPRDTRLAEPDMSEDEIDELQRRNLQILMFHDPARIDDLAVHIHRENLARGRIRSRPISLTDRLLKALPEIKASMAGIWGEHDVTVTGREGLDKRKEILRGLQPDAPFHVIEGAGHWVMYEAAEEFAGTLVGTLKTLAPY